MGNQDSDETSGLNSLFNFMSLAMTIRGDEEKYGSFELFAKEVAKRTVTLAAAFKDARGCIKIQPLKNNDELHETKTH